MKYRFLFFLIFFSYLTFAQNNVSVKSIDSLYRIITIGNDPYAKKGSKEMLRLCTEIYYQSKEIGYKLGQLNAITKMAEIYSNEQNYKESLNKISEGLLIAEEIKHYGNWANLLILQSGIYPELGYFKKSKESSNEALLVANKIYDIDKKHASRASVYRQMANNLNKEDKLINKYDSVLSYHKKAYNEAKKISSKFPKRDRYISKSAKNIGEVYVHLNEISETEKYLHEFELLTKKDIHHPNYVSFYTLKGAIENKKKNYHEAIDYFNKSIALSKEYKILPEELGESYIGMAEAYAGVADYKNQAKYLNKAKKIKDSLIISNKKIIENVANRNIKKENLLPKYSVITVLCVVLLLLIFYFFYIKNKQVKRKSVIDNEVEDSDVKNSFNENIEEVNIEAIVDFVEEQKRENTIANIEKVFKEKIEIDSLKLNNVIDLARKNDATFILNF